MERMLIVSNDWEAPFGYILAATDYLKNDCATAFIEDSNTAIEKLIKELLIKKEDGLYLWEGEVCDMSDNGKASYETTRFRLATPQDIRSFFPSLPK